MTASSTEKLIYYLSAARGATAKTATEICIQATSDPALHVFGELLQSPSIFALQGTAEQKFYDLLRLFAYGTVDDYKQNPDRFPQFTGNHWKKLRMLTLVSLANKNNFLNYSLLMEKLSLTTVREVEDVVLDAIYAGLVRARMDQRAAVVEIMSAAGRDVHTPDGVTEMIGVLRSWVDRSAQLVSAIDDKITFIGTQTKLVADQKAAAAANVERVRKDVLANNSFNADGFRNLRVDPHRDERMIPFDRHAKDFMNERRMAEGRSIRSRFDTRRNS